ncbi:MAG: hypothetical protein HYU69_10700, partial [Bacteroidetes bacterium]|nr:hypothetical protein [Bacteroidota bacterium]
KEKEKYYSGHIDYLVIQDKLRYELLKKENNLKNDIKTFLISVSPAYEDVKAENIYQRFGIPLNKTLIIHSGSVADWSGMDIILSLIKESRGHDVHFVIHSHKELSSSDPYKTAIDDLIRDGYPVSIHNHPFVDYAMYCGFLKGFHIGLAFYVSAAQRNPHLGKNLTNIGLASGKFSTYMMVGLPAIVNLEESFSDLFKKYKFGGILMDNDNFFSIVKRIKEEFYTYSTESKRMYNEVLNPEESVQTFFKDLFKS